MRKVFNNYMRLVNSYKDQVITLKLNALDNYVDNKGEKS